MVEVVEVMEVVRVLEVVEVVEVAGVMAPTLLPHTSDTASLCLPGR